MKLYLLRHCQSQHNYDRVLDGDEDFVNTDNGLTKEGARQAMVLSEELSKLKIDAIITSPLKRAIETIKPYLDEKREDHVISNLIVERNSGIFAGKPKSVMKDYCDKNGIDDMISFRPKNGESIIDVYERAKKFLSIIKKDYSGKSLLISSHNYFLICLEIVINKGRIENFYSVKDFGNGEFRSYVIT